MLAEFLLRKSQTRNRDRSQRGAALVEAAIVTPLFLLLIFSVFEVGFMFRTYLLTTGASSAAGRAGSAAGASPSADYVILRTIEHDLGLDNLKRLKSVVVYKADGPDGSVPRACLSVPVPAGVECNRYTAAEIFLPYVIEGQATGHWGCGDAAKDGGWCPTGRDSSIASAEGPEYLGVYIEMEHQYLTGFIGQTLPISVDRVVRLEPT